MPRLVGDESFEEDKDSTGEVGTRLEELGVMRVPEDDEDSIAGLVVSTAEETLSQEDERLALSVLTAPEADEVAIVRESVYSAVEEVLASGVDEKVELASDTGQTVVYAYTVEVTSPTEHWVEIGAQEVIV